MTAKQQAVLEAFAAARDYSIGAHAVSHVLWPEKRSRPLRAGQYMGKLARKGWLVRHHDFYFGARGHECYAGASYFLTIKGREALDKKRKGTK